MRTMLFLTCSNRLILVLCILFFSYVPLMSNASGTTSKGAVSMKKAVPVWVQGRETEKNLTLGFRGTFQVKKNKNLSLKITGSTLYRVFLNGEFLGYGPARACHEYYRVDDYDLSSKVKVGENILAIEVAGYNINTFYTIDQPSFLQAEVLSGNQVVLSTGANNDFEAFQVKERVQKVERYSYQRPFTEYYRMNSGYDQWRVNSKLENESLKLSVLPEVNLLGRNLPMPNFTIIRPGSTILSGTIELQKQEKYKKDRSLINISDKLKGYTENELEVVPSLTIQEITNTKQDSTIKPYSGQVIPLAEKQFCTLDMGTNLSGFIGSKVSCTEPTTLYFYFDEILTKGDVRAKTHMGGTNNYVVYELKPGDYNLESFESYTFKYLKVIAMKGSCKIQDVYMREYAYPMNPNATFESNNTKLNEIYKAAQQTFRQNTVDIFMDCPSRERAGWLCDSYFTAIMEKEFTGTSAVAHNFYENFALPKPLQTFRMECYPCVILQIITTDLLFQTGLCGLLFRSTITLSAEVIRFWLLS